MTANQIAYQRSLEEGRANRAREIETNRTNLANEGLKLQEVQEVHRSNVVREEETKRSNIAKETEAERSNRAKENIDYLRLQETRRSNAAQEQLTSRGQNIQQAYQSASVSEQSRANQAREIETKRSNLQQSADAYNLEERRQKGQNLRSYLDAVVQLQGTSQRTAAELLRNTNILQLLK